MWTACTNALGYGRAFYEGRTWNAHRLIYTLARGPVPATLQVDHLCKVRGCVNPEHLEDLLRCGVPLEIVQRLANHSDPAVTMGYAKVSASALKNWQRTQVNRHG